jgi:hypothetical protein
MTISCSRASRPLSSRWPATLDVHCHIATLRTSTVLFPFQKHVVSIPKSKEACLEHPVHKTCILASAYLGTHRHTVTCAIYSKIHEDTYPPALKWISTSPHAARTVHILSQHHRATQEPQILKRASRPQHKCSAALAYSHPYPAEQEPHHAIP